MSLFNSKKEKKPKRSVKMRIPLTDELKRWFEIATLAFDQTLYHPRQLYFGNGKRWKGAEWKDIGDIRDGLSLFRAVSEDLRQKWECYSDLNPNIYHGTRTVYVKSAWKSFIELAKKYEKDPESLSGEPKPPYYMYDTRTGTFRRYAPMEFFRTTVGHISKIDKENRKVVILDPNSRKYPGQYLELDVPERVDMDKFCTVQLRRKGDEVEVRFTYDTENSETMLDPDRIMAIDLGCVNLATCVTFGLGEDDFSKLYKAGPVLQAIQYRNKMKSRMQTVASRTSPVPYTRRMRKLVDRNKDRVAVLIHEISRSIIDDCVEKGIGTLAIGYNKNWKTGVKMGKKGNQKFVHIPFSDLVFQLKYKGAEAGIDVIEVNESYTSIVDHLAGQSFKEVKDMTQKERDAYRRKVRSVRGLYRSKVHTINSDVNGAIGVARKAKVLEDADLAALAARQDLVCPAVARMEKRNPCRGMERGREKDWKGDEQYMAFRKADKRFVKNLPEGISAAGLEIKKDETVQRENKWAIYDSKSGTLVDDAQGHGFKTFGSARRLMMCYRDAESELAEEEAREFEFREIA